MLPNSGCTALRINVAPDLAQKREIVLNAIEVLQRLGFVRPKFALISATEAVSPSVPSTVPRPAARMAP